MDKDYLARIAYENYANDYEADNETSMNWEDLGERSQSAWRASINHVLEFTKDEQPAPGKILPGDIALNAILSMAEVAQTTGSQAERIAIMTGIANVASTWILETNVAR